MLDLAEPPEGSKTTLRGREQSSAELLGRRTFTLGPEDSKVEERKDMQELRAELWPSQKPAGTGLRKPPGGL